MAKHINSSQPKHEKPNYKYLSDKAKEMVRGIFKFYEVPGGSMSFSFREFKGDEIQRYDFTDGEVYSIPLGVARHLNKNGWYPEYGFVQGEAGMKGGFSPDGKRMQISKKVHRYGFQSLEFVDIDDLSPAGPSILEVESTI